MGAELIIRAGNLPSDFIRANLPVRQECYEGNLTGRDRDCQDKEKAWTDSSSNAFVFHPVHPVRICLAAPLMLKTLRRVKLNA
jgi:hypothetical protein